MSRFKNARIWCTLTGTLLLVACGVEKIELINDIEEQDANEIVAALLESGVDAEKQRGKKNLSVAIFKKDIALAMEILNAKGLPNRHHSNLGEIFKKEGMVSTPLEERARYIYALSQELEYTLSQIDGVLVARVHVVLPERVAPGHPIQASSTAVLIKHLPSLDPDSISHKIQRVVTSSIPGLNADNVSLSFMLSEAKVREIKWVKVGKYFLTEESAKDLLNTIFWTVFSVIAFLVIGVVGGVAYFFLVVKKKRRQSVTKAEPVLDAAQQEGADYFNGEEIST